MNVFVAATVGLLLAGAAYGELNFLAAIFASFLWIEESKEIGDVSFDSENGKRLEFSQFSSVVMQRDSDRSAELIEQVINKLRFYFWANRWPFVRLIYYTRYSRSILLTNFQFPTGNLNLSMN